MQLARGTVIPGASARPPMTELVGGCFQGFAVKAQSAALQRQELDHALPMGKAHGYRSNKQEDT